MDNRTPTTRPLRTPFADRKGRFSDFWVLIVKARVLLCFVVLLFASTTTTSFLKVLVAAGIYLALNLALGFFTRSTLRRKRVRALPAVLDVVFTSYLVFISGGEPSVWYLLYIFPVLSVSRYLSYEGSVLLALLAATLYAIAALTAGDQTNLAALVLKILILLAISVVAGNLSRTRKRKEDDLVDVFLMVDNAIIANVKIDQILQMFVEGAVQFTESSLGQMTVFGEEQSSYFVTVQSDPKKLDWQVDAFAARFHSIVRQSKSAVSVLSIKQGKPSDITYEDPPGTKRHTYVVTAYVDDSRHMPRSAQFVPLIVNNEVRAVISLYSKDSFHYFEVDAIRLESLAPTLGIALKHSSDVEKTQRLQLLHTIGEALKVEQGLSEIFRTVVRLTWTRLGSEEAALFISDSHDKKNIQIRKEAVWGPTPEIAAKLQEFEPPYRPEESYVGEIFAKNHPVHLKQVPSSTLHYKTYADTLPSKEVRHYIGVPVSFGDHVMGVLRVINKRSSTYDIEAGNFELAEPGFDNDDVALTQTIASQVASAIRSTKFIEVNRYYKELVENSPDPIIVLDERGRINVFNKACETIWGCNETYAKGKHVSDFYESEEHAREIGLLLEEDLEHRIKDFEARIKAVNGEIIPISLSAAILYDSSGQKVGSIGVFKDLRQTKKLQEEKTRAESLATLGKMAHTTGHAVKHDIGTAVNYIDVLAYKARDDKRLSQIYAAVQESLSEAVDKFRNMLLIGRPRTPDKRVIGAAEIFSRLEPSLRTKAKSRNVEILIGYPDETKLLNADFDQLSQVFFNLLDNSIDAIEAKKSSGKGRIICEANAVNGCLRIDWKDNGCGIEPERLESVFAAFFTSKQSGTGLGLFIVKNIVESHDGSVRVQSEPGKGTIFTITIPLLPEPLSTVNSTVGEHSSANN